jgi:GntR family transcriptional regulator
MDLPQAGEGPFWMGRQIRDEVAGGAIDPDRLSASAPSTRPRYQQIVAALRKEIEDNTLKAGDMLPSEAELRERFSVSRHTIREALRALRDEGFVESRQGAATRVTKPENAIYTYSVSDVAELLQYATDVRYEIDKTSVVVADAALASRLACSVGSRWLRVEGFRYVKGDSTPLCWTEIYILSEYSGVAVQIGRQRGTIYSFIESMYGVRVAQVDQTLQAAAIPPQASEAIKFEGSDLAIVIRRTYRLGDGSIPLVAINYHSPTRLRLNWTLRRSANT